MLDYMNCNFVFRHNSAIVIYFVIYIKKISILTCLCFMYN